MIIEKIVATNFNYLRRVGSFGTENYYLMEQLKQIIEENYLLKKELVIYGIPTLKTPSSQSVYDVGFTSQQEIALPNLEKTILPMGNYCVFKIEHTTEAVQLFWQKIGTGKFELENHIKIDNSRPIMERYQLALVKEGFCEFCVPVK